MTQISLEIDFCILRVATLRTIDSIGAPMNDDDYCISSDGNDLSCSLHVPLKSRLFYHGTGKRNARKILREVFGFDVLWAG